MSNPTKDDEGPSDPNSGPSTRFEFIDINSSTARKQARAHVMREFMRQKRQDREALASGPSAEGKPEPTKQPRVKSTRQSTRVSPSSSFSDSSDATVARKGDVQVLRRGSSGASQSAVPFNVEDKISEQDTILRAASAVTKTPSVESSQDLMVTSASPRMRALSREGLLTPLDSYRRDLFQTFPVQLEEEDLPLVDHYLSVVPEMMCNFNGMRLKSGPASFNPARDVIIPQALHNPIAFQATVLAFAAGHLARLQGRVDTPQSIKHRVQSLRKIREHFSSQNIHPEDLDITIAMLSLASCEDRFGDSKPAWIHMRACMNMVGNFWGRLESRQARRLCTYMNWVSITMTGHDSCALKVVVPNLSPIRASSDRSSPFAANTSRSKEVDDTIRAVHAFINFLRQIEKVNRNRLVSQLKSQTRTRRKENFQPGSALHTLLSSPLGNRHGVRSNQIQKNCQFACTMCISAILLELNDSSAVLEGFLKRLSIRIVEQELDWNESTEVLMWILLYGDDEAEAEHKHSETLWWLGRMMNVAKRLSDDSWIEVSKTMLRCLVITGEDAPSEAQYEEWLNSLQRQLLAAPLSSHLNGEYQPTTL